MRILSQDLRHDFPYEKVCIEILDSGKIVAQGSIWNYANEDNWIVAAEYSSIEKAKKAMEMLRKAYTVLPIIMRNVDITDDAAEMLKKWEKQGIVYRTADNEPSSIECVNNGYFQFPSDEEIEV